MTTKTIHPAVFTGLLGGAALGVPTTALAVPLDSAAAAISDSLVFQFAAGCASGAIVAGGILYVADLISQRKALRESNELPDGAVVSDEAGADFSAVSVAQDDPTDQSDYVLYGIDTPVAEQPSDEALELDESPADLEQLEELDASSEEDKPRHMSKRKARHFAGDAAPNPGSQVRVMYSARHFTPEQAEQLTLTLMRVSQDVAPRGRHYSPTPVQDLSTAETIVLNSEVTEQLKVGQPKMEQPMVEVAETKEAASDDASDTVTKKLGLHERLFASTMQAYRALAARLSSTSAEDDIPIITRADASAYATASSQGAQAPENNKLESQDTVHSASSDGYRTSGRAARRAMDDEDSRAAYISRHVSEVDLGLFPELRSADELERNDMWQDALDAMGETLGQSSSAVFRDEVGGPSTIDDPDGLESPTEFIVFKQAAAQSQAVDNDTYVEYLLRDELSHSDNEVLRRSPHAHLRVIEGGTGPVRVRRRAGEAGAHARVGRHYAPQSFAREA